MKSLVLVKSGEYTPNLFNEFSQIVNGVAGSEDFQEQLRFVKRSDYTFRLFRSNAPAAPLALVAFTHDTSKQPTASTFFAIDLKLMQDVLANHEFVLLGSVIKDAVISDADLLPSLRYITRDEDDNLLDAVSGKRLIEGSTGTGPKSETVLSMVSMIKAGTLPIYYLILDNGSVGVSDFEDYFDEDAKSTVIPVNDFDGALAEHLMRINFGPEVTVIAKNNLFVKGPSTTLEFLTEPWLQYLDDTSRQLLPGLKISGSCDYVVDGPRVHLKVNKPVSTLRVEFNLGRFFSLVQSQERPVVEFIVYAE